MTVQFINESEETNMIMVETIGQIEKIAIGDGTIKAKSGGTKNGFIGTVSSGVVANASTTGLGLKVFENYAKGDEAYEWDTVVASGELMTAWDVKAQAGKNFRVSPNSITYATGENYASITEGTTLMGAGTDGNLAIIANATNISAGGTYFKVIKKINFGGNGVLAEVVVK